MLNSIEKSDFGDAHVAAEMQMAPKSRQIAGQTVCAIMGCVNINRTNGSADFDDRARLSQ
jgi:hypothetical protein